MPRGTPGTLLVPIPTYVGPKLRPEECLLAHPPKPNTHLCRPKTKAQRMVISLSSIQTQQKRYRAITKVVEANTHDPCPSLKHKDSSPIKNISAHNQM